MVNAGEVALRLPTPTALNKTHALVLTFTLTPSSSDAASPPDLLHRYTLLSGAAIPFSYLAQHYHWAGRTDIQEQVAYWTSPEDGDSRLDFDEGETVGEWKVIHWGLLVLFKPRVEKDATWMQTVMKPSALLRVRSESEQWSAEAGGEDWLKVLKRELRVGATREDRMKEAEERDPEFKGLVQRIQQLGLDVA